MVNVPKFIKSEWFMLLFMILFAPVGIALLFYYHNDKYGNVLKITVCILATMVLFSRCTPAKVVEKRVEVDKIQTVNVTKTVTETVTVTPQPTLTEKEKEAEAKLAEEEAKNLNAEAERTKAEAEKKPTLEDKDNYLIKTLQERPLMNGLGTKRIGTYGRALAAKELVTDEMLLGFDKYIQTKDFKYSFIDFNNGTGLHIIGAMYNYCNLSKNTTTNNFSFGSTIGYMIVDSENNKVNRSNYK